MPAKLTITSRVRINFPTTYLRFTSTNQGYLSGMTVNSAGAVVINQTKLYFVALSITFLQEGKYVDNTARIQVYRNNNTILDAYQSYDENDEITMYTAAYVNLNAGDVITASVSFAEPAGRELKEDVATTKEIKAKASPYTVATPMNENIINEQRNNNFNNNNNNIFVLALPNATFLNIV
jgi:hypothetical protein